MAETKIQWADCTFNPWRGCSKVSAGCANCYAEIGAKRNPGAAAAAGLTVAADQPGGPVATLQYDGVGVCEFCRSPQVFEKLAGDQEWIDCGSRNGIFRSDRCRKRAESRLRANLNNMVSAALRVRQKTRSLVSRGLLSAAQLDALEALATAEAEAAAFLGRAGAAP